MHNVFKIHAKIMKLLPVFKELNRDYELFKAVVNAGDMLNGIDNEVSLDDDDRPMNLRSLFGWMLSVLQTKMKDSSHSSSI